MKYPAILLLLSFALVGCGGGGATTVANSPFAGTYIGTFTVSDGEAGTANLTAATNGTIAGTIHNTTLVADGSISGNIQNNGTVSGAYQYTNEPAVGFSGTWALTNQQPPHLTGTVTSTVGNQTLSSTYDLVRQ
jgi:hypothetical protein